MTIGVWKKICILSLLFTLSIQVPPLKAERSSHRHTANEYITQPSPELLKALLVGYIRVFPVSYEDAWDAYKKGEIAFHDPNFEYGTCSVDAGGDCVLILVDFPRQ